MVASQFAAHATSRQTLALDYGPGWNGFSSGCLDSPQHVGRHMLLWVNLIDWMAPNSQVQVSSGSQNKSVQVKDELRRWSSPPNRLAWASSHMPLVSRSDISGCKLPEAQGTKGGSSLIRNVRMDRSNETHPAPNSTSNLIVVIVTLLKYKLALSSPDG